MILLLTVLLTQKTESPPPSSTPATQPTGFMRNMGGMMNRGARA